MADATTDPPNSEGPEAPAGETPPSAWWFVAPVIGLVIAAYVGAALHPTLAIERPLLLVALNPRIYHLLLVVGELAFWPYFTVAFVRLLIGDPLLYLLGRWHGDGARRWIERQVDGSSATFRFIDRWFPKFGPAFVFIAPNNIICPLAGATGMRPSLFMFLNVTGTTARLLVIYWFADVVEGPINWIRDLYADYQLPITVLFIVIVVAQITISARRGTNEVGDLVELEHEVEHEDEPGQDTADERATEPTSEEQA